MAHTCNVYCDGDVHVIRALRQTQDPETIQRDYAALGYEVVHVRAAGEVDLDAWKAAMTNWVQTINETTTSGRLTTVEHDYPWGSYPYLVWMRKRPTP